MAAVTWAEMVAALPAPELATAAAEVQALALAFAHETLNATRLGGESSYRLRRARMLLAAHLATVTPPGSGGSVIAGPVTSESTARISRSYASLVSAGDWSGSSYGQELTRLIRSSPARLPLVV